MSVDNLTSVSDCNDEPEQEVNYFKPIDSPFHFPEDFIWFDPVYFAEQL